MSSTQQIQDDTSSMSDEVFEPAEETERRKKGLCKDEELYFDPNKVNPNQIISPTTEFYTTEVETGGFGWGFKDTTNEFGVDNDDDNNNNGDDEEDQKTEKTIEENKKDETNDDWKSYPYDENQVIEDTLPRKVILLGDSGVGKTSFLVKYNTGVFKPASFSATVGVALMVMLLGDSGVGKTCLLVRFRDGTFLGGNFISTVGIDFRNKVVTIDHTKVKLQIWDTAGQERFRSVTHAYYRDAHALLLLYDVTNKISFDNIRAWLGEIKEYAQDDVVIMLLGNKADSAANDRQVKKEDGERLAKEYKVAFMETSAKTGLNVELTFIAIARQLKSRRTNSIDESKFNVVDYVNEKANQEKQTCPPCNM